MSDFPGSVRVTFDYTCTPRQTTDVMVEEFAECTSEEQLAKELQDAAPDVRYSIKPNSDDVRRLWELISFHRQRKTST
jgi:hypothetical protein